MKLQREAKIADSAMKEFEFEFGRKKRLKVLVIETDMTLDADNENFVIVGSHDKGITAVVINNPSGNNFMYEKVKQHAELTANYSTVQRTRFYYDMRLLEVEGKAFSIYVLNQTGNTFHVKCTIVFY